MSTDVTGLVVAVVGVTGTLVAPVLTQRLSLRARQQELDAERQRRAQEEVAERSRGEVAERKASYREFLTAERSHRRAIRDHLYAPSDQTHDEMLQARRVFDIAYAEAYLIAADPVLDAVVSYIHPLADVTQRVAEIDNGAVSGAEAEHERAELLKSLRGKVRIQVMAVRARMRADIRFEARIQHGEDQSTVRTEER